MAPIRRWPGQVWDAGKATSQQLRIRRAGQLVVFFGDNSFGWFPAELLVDFAEHLEEKAKQKTGNKARLAPNITPTRSPDPDPNPNPHPHPSRNREPNLNP